MDSVHRASTRAAAIVNKNSRGIKKDDKQKEPSSLKKIADNIKRSRSKGSTVDTSEYLGLEVPNTAQDIELDQTILNQTTSLTSSTSEVQPDIKPNCPLYPDPSDSEIQSEMPPPPRPLESDRKTLYQLEIIKQLAALGCVPDPPALEQLMTVHETLINDNSIPVKVNETYIRGYAAGWINHMRSLEKYNLDMMNTKIIPIISSLERTTKMLQDSPVLTTLDISEESSEPVKKKKKEDKPSEAEKGKNKIDPVKPKIPYTLTDDEVSDSWKKLPFQSKKLIMIWFMSEILGLRNDKYWEKDENLMIIINNLSAADLLEAFSMKQSNKSMAEIITFAKTVWSIKGVDLPE